MFVRLSAFVIWSLVGVTAMAWLLRFAAASPQAPSYTVTAARSSALHGDLSRLFGAAPALAVNAVEARDAPSRFRLLGVMAPRAATVDGGDAYGVALIAVDGKPARAYMVGARVEPDLVLRSVSRRSASIGKVQGGGLVTLELPALPPAATGVLPAPGAAAGVAPSLPIMSGPLPATVPTPVPLPVPGIPQPPIIQPQQGVVPSAPLLPTSPDSPRAQ